MTYMALGRSPHVTVNLATALLSTVATATVTSGRVVHLKSTWQGNRIISQVEIETDDGRREALNVLGGRLDGIGMSVADLPQVELGERGYLWHADGWLFGKATINGRREFTRAQTTASGEGVVWWDSNCVSVVPSTEGSDDIADDSEISAIQAAAENWRSTTLACAHMRIVASAPRANLSGGYSAEGPFENVIVWLEHEWGRAADGIAYPAGRAALTTLFYVDDPLAADDGRLLDADIELNGVEWTFSTGACDDSTQTADLENTVTHEFGHLLGLDHTCNSGAGEPPTDHQGQPLPSCGAAPKEVVATTMYAIAPACATYMRTPEQDDILGICTLYPIAADPTQCVPPAPVLAQTASSGWCSLAGGSPLDVGGLIPLLLLALLRFLAPPANAP